MKRSHKVALLAALLGLSTPLLGACSPLLTATHTPVVTLTRPLGDAVMVYVPAGEFLMGSTDADSKAGHDEKPQHAVYLDAFWIDRTEVTNAQYAQFLNALEGHADSCGGRQCLELKEGEDVDSHILRRDGRYEVEAGYDGHPVIEVTWYGAQAYCGWAGVRLPTEAEWEKAARGLDGQTYPWGNSAPDCSKAQYGDCSGATAPVGSKPAGASPYGALDMAGNVWEWVADWYDAGYYLSSPPANPQGPTSGEEKAFRGGSWGYLPQFTRTTDRGSNFPTYAGPNVGFRCADLASPLPSQSPSGSDDVSSPAGQWSTTCQRVPRSPPASYLSGSTLVPQNVLECSKSPGNVARLQTAAGGAKLLGATTLEE